MSVESECHIPIDLVTRYKARVTYDIWTNSAYEAIVLLHMIAEEWTPPVGDGFARRPPWRM